MKETLLRACGVYHHCIDVWAQKLPAAFVAAEQDAVRAASQACMSSQTFLAMVNPACAKPRFLARHVDMDLLQVASTSVPPADVSQVAVFRTTLIKYEKQAG